MWRSYNQSEVIANELSKLSGRPVFNCPKRVKRTKYQATLTADERQKNLSRAFEVKDTLNYQRPKHSGKVFVLVDDINALKAFNFNRTVFFGTYSYVLTNKLIGHLFLAGISIGLDLWPWKIGNKRFIEPDFLI